MMRIPKYTAGMFKRKMPRFGAEGISPPRMNKPRMMSKGGSTADTEAMQNEKNVAKFLNQPETEADAKMKQAEETAPGKDADQPGNIKAKPKAKEKPKPTPPPQKYDDAEVVVTPEEGKKQLEEDRKQDLEEARKKALEKYMEEQEAARQKKYGLEKVAPSKPKAVLLRKGGSVSSASSRGDGIAQRGKTRGRMV